MQFDERMPGESALAFQYLEVYRDSNPSDRSLRKLTKVEINGKKRNLKTISQWSSQFQWQKRVQAFDAENTRRAAQQVAARQQAEIKAFISKDLEIGSAFQKFISEHLVEIEQKPNIQELCQLALAYKETRLWMRELIGILQETNNATIERVDSSDARYPVHPKKTKYKERFSTARQGATTATLPATPSGESPSTNNDESSDVLIKLLHRQSCGAVLESAIDTLVDIKTGFMARQRAEGASKNRMDETTLLPSEQETYEHLRKAWIWDLALQQATLTLPESYIREKSVSEEIKERNENHIRIEKKIADGLTLADLSPRSDDFRDDSSLSDEQRAEYAEQEYERAYILLSLNQHTIEELTQGIAIAKQLEAELRQQIPRNHPEVKAEVKRIKEWFKKNPSSLYQLCPEPLYRGKKSDNA